MKTVKKPVVVPHTQDSRVAVMRVANALLLSHSRDQMEKLVLDMIREARGRRIA